VGCRHRAINLFLKSYKEQWLQVEPPGHDSLIEDITVCITLFRRSFPPLRSNSTAFSCGASVVQQLIQLDVKHL